MCEESNRTSLDPKLEKHSGTFQTFLCKLRVGASALLLLRLRRGLTNDVPLCVRGISDRDLSQSDSPYRAFLMKFPLFFLKTLLCLENQNKILYQIE